MACHISCALYVTVCDYHQSENKEGSMIGILIITDAPPPSGTSSFEATSSTDTGAVIGGTLLGVLALVVLVTALLGCLIYYKRRKGRKLNKRY